MSIAERKAIKVGQLLAILNQRLLRHTETAKCRIISIAPLMTANKDICNWSPTVTWNANGQNREQAMPVVKRLVMNAQKEYNLLPFGSV